MTTRARGSATVALVVGVLWMSMGSAWGEGAPAPGAVSASTLKLPDGPGSVRGLTEDPSVDVFTGQIGYQIPIETPSAPTGFAPSLQISYAGGLGNGPIGVGWSLGSAEIRRSLRQGVPSYDASDELEISGIASGRLVETGRGGYLVEGQGTSILLAPKDGGFVAWDSAGNRYDFGTTAASRVYSDGNVASWKLNEIQTPGGEQRIAYAYVRDGQELYLSSITWGPDQVFEVRLTYGSRPDAVTSYRTGFEITTARRLESITVRSHEEEIRRYELTYLDEDSQKANPHALSHLARVEMFGRGGTESLPPVTFGYAMPTPGAPEELAGTAGWRLEERGVTFADINRDGAADLFSFELGSHIWRKNQGDTFVEGGIVGGPRDTRLPTARLLDLDGDSVLDVVHTVASAWHVYHLEEGAWVDGGTVENSYGLPLFERIELADLNGDGRPEAILWNDNGLEVRFGGAGGFAAPVLRPRIGNRILPGPQVAWHDLNGDGLDDAVAFEPRWMDVYLSRGDGTFATRQQIAYPFAGEYDPERIRVADLNRDGLLDLVRFTLGHVQWYPGRPVVGDRAFAAEPVAIARPQEVPADAVVAIADANGNGSQDLIWSTPRGLWLIDIAGPTSAGMLRSIDNGLGKRVVIHYESSAQLAIAADKAGTPWAHALPTAIPLPTRVEVNIGGGTPRRTVLHRVRDGFWDGQERRFAGFLVGETGNAFTSRIERTFYHPGLGDDRVLRGATLATEVEVGGQLVLRTEHTWETQALPDEVARANPLARVGLLTNALTYHYEGVAAPIVTHAETRYDEFGRTIEAIDHGRLDRTGDETRQVNRYTDATTRSARSLPCEQEITDGSGAVIGRSRTYYGDTSKIEALCVAGRGWKRRTEGWLDTDDRWLTITEAEYDELGNPTRAYADGVWRQLDYDDSGLFAVTERVSPSEKKELVWSAEWDRALGVVNRVTDPAGVSIAIGYDGLGRVISMATGDARPHAYYYYAWRAPSPMTFTYVYDGAADTIPTLNQETGGNGWRMSVAVANGAGETLYTATRLTEQRWILDGYQERDPLGRVVFVGQALYWDEQLPGGRPRGIVGQQVIYDDLDRPIEKRLPTGHRTNIRYAAFEVQTEADDLAPVTTYLDGQDRIWRTTRTVGNDAAAITESVTAIYDAASRITEMRLQDGAISHAFTYDSLGRLTFATDPDIGERHLEWDDAGRLVRHENGAGQAVSFEYDQAGRLLRNAADDGTAFVYHYDKSKSDGFGRTAGRLAWVEEPTGTVHLGYDVAGRAIRARRTIDGKTAEERRDYAPSGLLLAVHYNDELHVPVVYDRAGRPTAVGQVWEVTEQDAAGRILGERYGNGITQTYQRDELGLTSETVVARDETSLYDIVIGRTAYGAVDAVTDRDGRGLDHTATFGYDGAARLTSATVGRGAAHSFQYEYDALQNMVRREASGPGTIGVLAGNYEYDEHGPRQLSQILAPDGTSIAAFDYDAAGRQTRSADRTLHYNGLDQLIRVELPEGVVEHAYGYDGLRIRTRSVDGTEQIWFSEGLSDKDGLREHTISLNSRILARVTQAPEGRTSNSAAAGASTTRWPLITLLLALASLFTMGLAWTARVRPRRRLAAARGLALTLLAGIGLSCGGGTQWHTDQILYAHAGVSPGPVLFTDEAGIVVAERRYEPFGGTIDSYSETDGQTGLIDFARISYNALNKQSDPDTEWSYHGARWLAPQTAQWLTPDPPVKGPDPEFMDKPWTLHPYQYVSQNPILYWDPDGNEQEHVKVLNDGSVYTHAHGPNGQDVYYIYIPDSPTYGGGKFVNSFAYDSSRYLAEQRTDGRLAVGIAYVGAADNVAFELWFTSVRIGAGAASASLSTAFGVVNFISDVNATSNAIRSCQGDSLCAAEVWIETTSPGLPGIAGPKGTKPTTLEPGPHAERSVPARGPQRDFTRGERNAVNEIGQRNGCHTCGTTDPGTKSGDFVPDHQPPNAVNPPGKPQRLYPHCLGCSRRQGGEIRSRQ